MPHSSHKKAWNCHVLWFLICEERRERSDKALMCCAVCCPLTSWCFFFYLLSFILCRFGAAELKWKTFLSLVFVSSSLPSDPDTLFENPSLLSTFTFLHCSVQSSLNIHLKENPCLTCFYWPLSWGPSGFSLFMLLHIKVCRKSTTWWQYSLWKETLPSQQ